MEWYWFLAIYLGIGFFRAGAHLSTGRVGGLGVWATLTFFMLSEPYFGFFFR